MRPPSQPEIKICGVTTLDMIEAVRMNGADYVGFVSFAASPRHISTATMATLAREAQSIRRVVLLVDPSDSDVDQALEAAEPFALQLHGSETPARVEAVKLRAGTEVWKALPVAAESDLAASADYPADRFLFDAKPPRNADRPGGLGETFDWSLLSDLDLDRPWFLAGGLRPDDVAEALRTTHAPGVDVSSGVERAPGVKDAELIAAFIKNARGAL